MTKSKPSSVPISVRKMVANLVRSVGSPNKTVPLPPSPVMRSVIEIRGFCRRSKSPG